MPIQAKDECVFYYQVMRKFENWGEDSIQIKNMNE